MKLVICVYDEGGQRDRNARTCGRVQRVIKFTLSASKQIDKQIAGLAGWRGRTMAHVRKVISDADPALKEEFKDHIKISFLKGASLPDPHHLFNSGLEAKASRAIDLNEGGAINE
jgi:hypothetical protein